VTAHEQTKFKFNRYNAQSFSVKCCYSTLCLGHALLNDKNNNNNDNEYSQKSAQAANVLLRVLSALNRNVFSVFLKVLKRYICYHRSHGKPFQTTRAQLEKMWSCPRPWN